MKKTINAKPLPVGEKNDITHGITICAGFLGKKCLRWRWTADLLVPTGTEPWPSADARFAVHAAPGILPETGVIIY